MKIYLVGGAVRDELLQREVTEKDWVVVGATPEQMLQKDFQQVGKEFPVFLHPKTKEEYALARTERKSGIGYTGFTVEAAPSISLEEDLLRRDLTVNAMAKDESGQIIDPFNGQADLHNRLLRHVSDAFIEDPLRVLRVARFAARYHQYGFTVADETLSLMRKISESGELESLSAERVWKETEKSLTEPNPEVFFNTLKQVDALRYWFREIEALWGVPNPPKWHPEIDTGVHCMMVVQQAAKLSELVAVRFAALTHDLGKALTPQEKWPSHHGHEKAGLVPLKNLCDRLKVPNELRDLASLVCEHHGKIHRAKELNPSTILKLFDASDAWRKPERFQNVLLACEADAKGRTGFENNAYPQASYLADCLTTAASVDVQSIIASGKKGPEIKDALREERLTRIASIKATA